MADEVKKMADIDLRITHLEETINKVADYVARTEEGKKAKDEVISTLNRALEEAKNELSAKQAEDEVSQIYKLAEITPPEK